MQRGNSSETSLHVLSPQIPSLLPLNTNNTSQNNNLNLSNLNNVQTINSSQHNLNSNVTIQELRKMSLGCRRAYIGSFVGSSDPTFKKSKLHSIREEDIQTQIERIQHTNLPTKRKQEAITKLKFRSDENNNPLDKREFWFEFQETLDRKRSFVGRPKQNETNFSYAVIEFEPITKKAYIYPARHIEFSMKDQMVSDKNSSAEFAEKKYRQDLRKLRKKREQQCKPFEHLSKLFGHNKIENNLQNNNNQDNDNDDNLNKILQEYESGDAFKVVDKIKVKNNQSNDNVLDDEDEDDLEFNNNENNNTTTNDNINDKIGAGDNTKKKIDWNELMGLEIQEKKENDRIDSKRLKKNRERGNLEELPDYDKDASDDEDENNLKDWDLVDDDEEELLSDKDDSENDESYQKLQKLAQEDPEAKDYPINTGNNPNNNDSNNNNNNDDDNKNENNNEQNKDNDKDSNKNYDTDDETWMNISDDEDDNKNNNLNNNNKRPHAGINKNTSNKKRKLDDGIKRATSLLIRATNNDIKEADVIKILNRYPDGIDINKLYKKVHAVVNKVNQNDFKEIIRKVARIENQIVFPINQTK